MHCVIRKQISIFHIFIALNNKFRFLKWPNLTHFMQSDLSTAAKEASTNVWRQTHKLVKTLLRLLVWIWLEITWNQSQKAKTVITWQSRTFPSVARAVLRTDLKQIRFPVSVCSMCVRRGLPACLLLWTHHFTFTHNHRSPFVFLRSTGLSDRSSLVTSFSITASSFGYCFRLFITLIACC